jgi:hypothetical protein
VVKHLHVVQKGWGSIPAVEGTVFFNYIIPLNMNYEGNLNKFSKIGLNPD